MVLWMPDEEEKSTVRGAPKTQVQKNEPGAPSVSFWFVWVRNLSRSIGGSFE